MYNCTNYYLISTILHSLCSVYIKWLDKFGRAKLKKIRYRICKTTSSAGYDPENERGDKTSGGASTRLITTHLPPGHCHPLTLHGCRR